MGPLEAVGIALLGLGAGLIGGLAGVGGSMVMLPGLHLLRPGAPSEEHHLFVAAAMTVNLAVAIPAAIQHAKAGAVRRDLLPAIFGAALVFIVVGVLVSNRVSGDALSAALGVFILAYCAMNVWRLTKSKVDTEPPAERVTTAKLLVCGAAGGSAAGLLGLGGGVVLVPLLQVLCKVPLRQSIATSSAAICLTATFGAGMKLATLSSHNQSVAKALMLAGLMAPTAVVGGLLGAKLTHRLPLRGVRLVVTVLLALAAFNLLRKAW